eukprot:5388405-Alexandrium_andersonii.AAC.1
MALSAMSQACSSHLRASSLSRLPWARSAHLPSSAVVVAASASLLQVRTASASNPQPGGGCHSGLLSREGTHTI